MVRKEKFLSTNRQMLHQQFSTSSISKKTKIITFFINSRSLNFRGSSKFCCVSFILLNQRYWKNFTIKRAVTSSSSLFILLTVKFWIKVEEKASYLLNNPWSGGWTRVPNSGMTTLPASVFFRKLSPATNLLA